MSNTVITNYTDLNGPSTKADSSVVVIVNKDGSLSVDQNLLGTLMGTDGCQSSGISVVRVGHEGRPDDATDSENEDDDKIPHVTLTVDSYYNEPNSIIKYDSGAEMLQSLRIETRENSLLGFHNDHCYTALTSPSQQVVSFPHKERTEQVTTYNEPVIQISHTPPPKPVPSSKKITILEQKIIPKGKKLQLKQTDLPTILKSNEVLHKPSPGPKKNEQPETDKIEDRLKRLEESSDASSLSSSGESIADRDSDSDYKDQKVISLKPRKTKAKPRILKTLTAKSSKLDNKSTPKFKPQKSVKKNDREIKDMRTLKLKEFEKKPDQDVDLESLLPANKIAVSAANIEFNKTVLKQTPKPIKKERKTPAHVTALLSDMTSLFSTPDVIRRVSTDNKPPSKADKDMPCESPSTSNLSKDNKPENTKVLEVHRGKVPRTTILGKKDNILFSSGDKDKGCDIIPHIDDILAEILEDTENIPTSPKPHPNIQPVINTPSITTLDQPDDGLTDDVLYHVAELVQSSDKLKEVIDTQVMHVDTPSDEATILSFQEAFSKVQAKTTPKPTPLKEKPIQIVKSDGRVITLPPIEAPATRSSKRKIQMEAIPVNTPETPARPPPLNITQPQADDSLEIQLQTPVVTNNFMNRKQPSTKLLASDTPTEKSSVESQESWNSEDDPFRLWCICKQPHNNRFMICCDGCEDWFHGKCVNITKAMGQQMEEQGIEWRCPNCIKKTKSTPKSANKTLSAQRKNASPDSPMEHLKDSLPGDGSLKTNCIVCKKSARASSIYCSDGCILKHAQDSLGGQSSPTKPEVEAGKPSEKLKSDARVIVFERKSGRLLAGPNAPTAADLKSWLQKNPTFEVVRPGALSSIKPGIAKKPSEPRRVQTTLSLDRSAKAPPEQSSSPVRVPQSDVRDRRLLLSRRDDSSPSPSPKVATRAQPPQRPAAAGCSGAPSPAIQRTPTPKANPVQVVDTPRASTSAADPRKVSARNALNRTLATEKVASSPATRRKHSFAETKPKMSTFDPNRDNVRKSLQEQMCLRMKATDAAKFSESQIQKFAIETETELYELFRDVGMKYKAKYRSLIFNIKDRKNLTLWEKICKKTITPQQLVRLTPEEMASQELSEWRDQESKHQLELIKKSELDLLAATKTYVLKTHKGEEVMETKESVSTELDRNVPVEHLVTALNDSTVGEEVTREVERDLAGGTSKPNTEEKKESKNRKRERDGSSIRSKKSRRNSSPSGRRKSTRDSGRRSDRRSSRKSEYRERGEKESRSERRSTRRVHSENKPRRSGSKDRSRREVRDARVEERARSRPRSRRAASRSRSSSKGREKKSSRAGGRLRKQSDSDERDRRHRSRSNLAVGDDSTKLRSRSQDNTYTKHNTESTDSDSLERPKSASLKESHPEYDPHEPMITSAVSEEDLRKSEDAFEITYKNEILDSGIEYDPSKMFTLDSSVLSSKPIDSQDKAAGVASAETESDQEPSSTVENAAATVWNGCINMVDVARFYVSAHEVSGSVMDLEEELGAELEIVGRIDPDTVWDYIHKTKKNSAINVDLLRLQAANDEEKMQYIALYSYLSSRSRLGVVKVSHSQTIKDLYIIPLRANTSLPPVLLPLLGPGLGPGPGQGPGPGLGDARTHLLIAVLVRKKRLPQNLHKDIVPAKLSRKRSYTPPAACQRSRTPPATSPRRRAKPLPLPTYPASSLSTSVKDQIAASLARAEEGDEAYSPGGSSSGSAPPAAPLAAPLAAPPAAAVLRTKMEELNRQIEEQKMQILKMAQADSSLTGDDEAYSPSRPMTPPPVSTLADIALPSNLQEILANIKQRSENTSTDVDMRNLP